MLSIHHPAHGFGVTEVIGVDPGDEGGHATALRAALAADGVLVLRMPRALADAELQAVARCFGPIKDPVGRAKDGSLHRYDQPRQINRARHVEGLPIAEGRRLLQALQDHAEARAPRCQHDWRDHDVLVWDNASVQHRAAGNFALGEPRRFWRYMIAGARPA